MHMENPIERIRINRRASVKWGDDIHTIELEAMVLITNPQEAIDTARKIVETMKNMIDDEKLWFGKEYKPEAMETAENGKEAGTEKAIPPKREQPPSTRPLTIAQEEFLHDLYIREDKKAKIDEWLTKFNKKRIIDLTSEEASKILDDIVGSKKRK
jgi:hypothetical protein